MQKIKKFFKDNYKIFIIYIAIIVVISIPLPYYIYAPGGLVNIDKRINIEQSNKSEGSFNLSYVTEYKGTAMTLLISLFNKNWNVITKKDLVLDNETIKDYNVRDRLLLQESYNNATIVAYQKANKVLNITKNNLFVLYLFEESDTNLQVGDQIIAVDRKRIESKEQLNTIIQSHDVGDILEIEVKNKVKKYKRTAKLIQIENQTIIGIGLIELNDIETSPKITFNYAKDEYGSSGGLMLALAIYNSLTEEDITKGKTIVGTGTIDKKGNVGEIDGVQYKIQGAIKKNVDLFIVPNSNLKEALKVKKENNYKIKIIGVDTFDEVLDYLDNN